MKKIINGKRYDTATAKSLGAKSYGTPGDFYYWKEELFKKKGGEFFLYGKGGARSKYSEAVGLSSWSGGDRIMPMTYKEAQDWAEEYLTADEYEEIFGSIEEDDSLEIITLKMPKSTCEKLRRKASQDGRQYSEVCAAAIEAYVGRKEENEQ